MRYNTDVEATPCGVAISIEVWAGYAIFSLDAKHCVFCTACVACTIHTCRTRNRLRATPGSRALRKGQIGDGAIDFGTTVSARAGGVAEFG